MKIVDSGSCHQRVPDDFLEFLKNQLGNNVLIVFSGTDKFKFYDSGVETFPATCLHSFSLT